MAHEKTPLLGRMPEILNNERNRDQFQIEFSDGVAEYVLPKAPVLRVHSVRDESGEYTEGTDYEILEDERIAWDVGGDQPDDGVLFTVDITFETIIYRYTSSFDEEFHFFTHEAEEVEGSHQLDNAYGEDLDRIGELFGALGQRRGRDDSDYRVYLRSVVQSFNGRGSLSGLEFAIASAIGTTPDNVNIIENFSELQYSVEIENVDTGFISSAINDLAELADPSVVELDEAIIILDEGGVLVGGNPTTTVESAAGLGGETLTLDGNSTLG